MVAAILLAAASSIIIVFILKRLTGMMLRYGSLGLYFILLSQFHCLLKSSERDIAAIYLVVTVCSIFLLAVDIAKRNALPRYESGEKTE